MAIKYKWLVEQLREIISDSIQKGINKLPTEQELAVRYRVSRQTVRAALAVLEDEREIRRIKRYSNSTGGRWIFLQGLPHSQSCGPGTANPSVSFEKSAAGTYCGACKKRLTIT